MTISFIDILYLHVVVAHFQLTDEHLSIRGLMRETNRLISTYNIPPSHVTTVKSRAYALASLKKWQVLGVINDRNEPTKEGYKLLDALELGTYSRIASWSTWPVEIPVRNNQVILQEAKRLVVKTLYN